ncbi:Aldo-ket-red domain-containing protein [Mycena venus]|uniref:Aldo-ket-red domain-containing protein n=1 Tax=Mycena venus TaxID=2733690 RepID=A0A8H7CJ63_9AGAR|nr:Aldo-ket-red domain-containing protein [Mycena venus]
MVKCGPFIVAAGTSTRSQVEIQRQARHAIWPNSARFSGSGPSLPAQLTADCCRQSTRFSGASCSISPMASSTPSKMQYVRLGNSGLKVSRIILGCMSYGTPEWQAWVLPEEEGLKHIKAAYDAGINTFDTANVYSNGLSEVVLGKAIKQFNLPRDEIVVMTKASSTIFLLYFVVGREPNVAFLNPADNPDNAGYCNQHGLSRKHIFDSVKHSLKRLQLDYIDVLQCHRFDKETPIEETMQALHDVVKAGYVRYIGMSSCWAYQFSAMQNYAIQNNLTPFISMQNHYSLVYREEEREMFPTLKHFKVGSIPWSPLGRGLLTRPISEQSKRGAVDRHGFATRTTKMIKSYANDASTSIVNRVEELSKKKGARVTAPIVGSTSLENLRELIAAVNIELTEEEMKYLEEPYQPRNIIGHS